MIAKLLSVLRPRNSKQSLISPSFLLRLFIYGGIGVNLILPFYNFHSNSFQRQRYLPSQQIDLHAKNFIVSLNQAQENYYLSHGHFSASIQDLKLDTTLNSNTYSYRIVSTMPLSLAQPLAQPQNSDSNIEQVIMIVQSKELRLNSYMGVVYSFSNNSNVHSIAAVCKIPRYMPLPTTMPILRKNTIQCPSGTIQLGSNNM